MPLAHHKFLTHGDAGASFYTEITAEQLKALKAAGQDCGDGYDMCVSKEGFAALKSTEGLPHVKRQKRPIDMTILVS